jgi:hypothetical protein
MDKIRVLTNFILLTVYGFAVYLIIILTPIALAWALTGSPDLRTKTCVLQNVTVIEEKQLQLTLYYYIDWVYGHTIQNFDFTYKNMEDYVHEHDYYSHLIGSNITCCIYGVTSIKKVGLCLSPYIIKYTFIGLTAIYVILFLIMAITLSIPKRVETY